MKLPPEPRAPGVVQMLRFSTRPLPFLEECARTLGDPFTFTLPGLGKYVMLSSPELIKQVFTEDAEVLHAGKANAILEPVVGPNSVLLLDGKPHLRQRRLLMPPLHGERMHAYAKLMAEITVAEIERMPRGEPFALHPHMQSITLQVILRAVFGLDAGAKMDALAKLLTEYLEPPPALMTFVPVDYLDFPFSPYRTFKRRRAAVDRALRAIVRERTKQPDAASRCDILSLLLAARDEDGQPMTEDELRDELMTMLLAGHETTATALAWTFANVLGAPDVAARLESELGAHVPHARVQPDALVTNEYLDAVLKESLRLRPILPDVVRRVQAPYRIGGYDIPVGYYLAPCIYLTQRRADLYPEPERFRPERFVGVKPDPYAWFPFGGGIRRCLGMAFANYEMKIVLGTVLSRVRLRLASSSPIRVERRTITLAPSGGTRVVLDAPIARTAPPSPESTSTRPLETA